VSFRIPTARLPRLPGRRARLVAPILLALVVLIIVTVVYVRVYTDYLWFQSVDYTTVFSRRLITKIVLFFVFGGVMAIAVGANVVIAHRLRPPFRPMSPEQQQLEVLTQALHRWRRWVLAGVLVLVGAIAGAAAAGRWRTWLLWRNGQHFGIKDPQFHKDVSYFAFTYPFQRWILGVLFAIVIVSLIAVLLTAYLYGGLRPQTPGAKVTPAARAHISVLLGIFVLLKAVAYWLDRYGVNFSRRGFVDTGASYTDVHAVLPAKTILVFVAVICAGIFFANVRIRNWRLPLIAFGLMVGSAIVIGGIYPLLVQQFSVRPSEADKESSYIARNIAETRLAYNLQPTSQVQSVDYPGAVTGDAKTLRADSATLPNARVLDPTVLPDTFQQLQGFKSFYSFPSSLDVDRYQVNGKEQEELVAARELDVSGLQTGQKSWINQHLVYTHGFGFVAAPSNAVKADDGTPVFDESDIPPHGDLSNTFQPRIYFGEQSPNYSVVGAPSGAKPRELDFPDNSGIGQENNTYNGSGGVPIGSSWRRLLYALKYGDKNLLFSSGVNSDSRLLYVRNPRDRVAKVAPFLTLDSDPYPAIVGDRVDWIVDGYTTTDGFPYAARTSLTSATEDTLTQQRAASRKPSGQVNYIRNSVKATVDAYDGTVTLYQWGPHDPVLSAWEHAFPGIIKPEASMPTDLRAHLRYPEDLFKVQRTLLTRYHITDPHAFYGGTDYWKVPTDPSSPQNPQPPQPPYYLTMALPGQTTPSFQLTTPLLQNNGRNLAAFVSVDSDPASSSYGVMRVLHLPTSSLIPGPGQVHNDFRTFPAASTQIALLDQRGSHVDEGNLLTLPLGGSFVYIEPIYVRSTAATSFPTLKRVLVSWNGNIAYEPTLSKALDVAFGTATPAPPPTTGQPGPPPTTGGVSAQVAKLVTQLQSAQADAQRALRAGDLTAYADAEKRVAALISRLAAASARG
jgi:uncharacterized membrane protein (UPF0182 family)